MKDKICKFCGNIAAVKVSLSKGCVCYPEDKEQWLCLQHLSRATPIGDMKVIENRRK